MKNIYSYDKERVVLISFLEKYLNKIEYKDLFVTPNERRIKKFIGKTIGKICNEFYGIIEKEAISQNMYTYELRSRSKASKVFLRKKYDFFDEDIVWKEILIYLMNTKDNNGLLDFIKEIEPLSFDPALVSDYISSLNSDIKKQDFIYEIEEYYDDVDDKKERIQMLELINNPNVIWDKEVDEIVDDEDFEFRDDEN